MDIGQRRLLNLDAERSRSIGDGFVRRVFRRAAKDETAIRDVVRLEQKRIQGIAVTETANAFNDERRRVLAQVRPQVILYRVWDATLDKRTCMICRDADGEAVPMGDAFSSGEPGDVHPWCRCVESFLPVQLIQESIAA